MRTVQEEMQLLLYSHRSGEKFSLPTSWMSTQRARAAMW